MFECKECGEEFETMKGLKVHIGMVHRGEQTKNKIRKMISIPKSTIRDVQSIRDDQGLANFSATIEFIAKNFKTNKNIEKRLKILEEKLEDMYDVVKF